MSELLPCPFCGGEASKRLFYKGKYRVHCNVCDAHSGDVCDTEAEAIAAWNTRVDYHGYEQAAIEDCDRLQAQVDKLADERYRYKLQCERYEAKIDKLEELARDLHADLMEYGCTPNAHRANYKPRFEALGIEVDDDVRVR